MQISFYCLKWRSRTLASQARELGSPSSGCLTSQRRPRRSARVAEGNTLPRHVGKGPSDSLLVFVLGSDGSISSTSVVGGQMSRKTRSRSCQVSHFLGQRGRALWYCFASFLLHRSCNSQTAASKGLPHVGFRALFLVTMDCWWPMALYWGKVLTKALSRSIANFYSSFCALCCWSKWLQLLNAAHLFGRFIPVCLPLVIVTERER